MVPNLVHPAAALRLLHGLVPSAVSIVIRLLASLRERGPQEVSDVGTTSACAPASSLLDGTPPSLVRTTPR